MLSQIFRVCELSWDDLRNIKRWFRRDEAREGFTLESFANNPTMRVAKATNAIGQTIVLCPIEPCYIIGAFLRNPDATGPELPLAGDCIDMELSKLAQREGVNKFLIAIPDSRPSEPGEKWIRVIERTVPQPVVTGGVTREQATAAHTN
jgi:hypothetical protein